MNTSRTLHILKNAILIEQKGKSLYQTAMEKAKDETVKAFFKDLADDELEHMEILEKQFKAYAEDGKFMGSELKSSDGPDILDDVLKEKINAAGFEATAITAAISFEEKAVRMYEQRSKEAADPEEKKMYHWLSVWEQTHLKKLTALDKALTEKIWEDNNFWPF